MRGDITWVKPGYNGTAWGSWKSPSNPSITDNSEHIIISSNEKLKKEGDKLNIIISRDEFKDWITGVWEMHPASDAEHPAVFPEELPRRCIKLYSYEGDLVLDPFCGVGTTLKVADELNRNYIGIDISENYCNIARKRLNNIQMPLFK